MPPKEFIIPPDVPKRSLRDLPLLAEQSASYGVKALPSHKWAMHYPERDSVRQEKLQGLLEGKYKPEEVAPLLRPDAITYDIKDLEKEDGYHVVSSRIKQASAKAAYYNHQRFAEMVAGMTGKAIDVETIQTVYDGIAQSRYAKAMLDAYGQTGREQMETALRTEAAEIRDIFDSLQPVERVLNALHTDWLCEDAHYIRTDQRDEILNKLTLSERELYNKLVGTYREYVQSGEKLAYDSLVGRVKDTIPQFKPEPRPTEPQESGDEMSPEMKDLMKEIDPFMDQVGPPGTSGDPGISLEDQDEYHTPPPTQGETKEKKEVQPLFEITPSGKSTGPLLGNYCSGRKSYYDIQTKTWSKKKKIVSYSNAIKGDQRQTISRTMPGGLESIPIPNNYALDPSSLKYKGTQPQIYRDQNGCFYIKSAGQCSYSIDFLEEKPPFVGHPIPEDSQPVYQGALSAKTEQFISNLKGSPLEMTEAVRQYIWTNHFYPGGGDLNLANALQYKLRHGSAPDKYFQNIDASEYLECYSANELLVAIMRKKGAPGRLVGGHHIDSAYQGKAVIDETTGHAWAEIWDGIGWRRFDATPQPKPEDIKKDQKKKPTDNTPTQSCKDGGIDSQPPPQKQKGEKQKGQKSGQSRQQMGEASDAEVDQAESTLEQAEQTLEKMEQQRQSLNQKISEAESFRDLQKLKEEMKQEDLLDEMNEELEDKLAAKEKQMKREMKEDLNELLDDGFIDEEEADKLEKSLEEFDLDKLDQLQKQIDEESKLHEEYEEIREEVLPAVDEWFEFFAGRLPRQEEFDEDDSYLGKAGKLDRKAVMRPRNLMFGTVKHPRIIKPEVKPLFIAFKVLDVSGSMGEGNKLRTARKFLIFTNELFARIGSQYGYVKSADYIFSDAPQVIKNCAQDYDSPERYTYPDRSRSTVKARLMKMTQADGGTNMLDAFKAAAKDLNEQVREYPDHASAMYFLGDGDDTCGNKDKIIKFLKSEDTERGFGRHMLSAIMLGDKKLKSELADIFGEERTNVAGNFDSLVEQYMLQFDSDIQEYLRNMTVPATL